MNLSAAVVRLYFQCGCCDLSASTFALSSDDREERAYRILEAHAIARPDCPAVPEQIRAVRTEAIRKPNDPSSWGNAAGRGFVSDSRFGSGQVIKRTNRDVSRKWRRVGGTL